MEMFFSIFIWVWFFVFVEFISVFGFVTFQIFFVVAKFEWVGMIASRI